MSHAIEPRVFTYPETQAQIRLARVDDQDVPWFVAKDVCEVLGIVKVSNTVALLDDDERGAHTVGTPSGPQQMNIVSESGLYSLILRSRKPEAKRFKRWVTHDVLPSIRRTGQYVHSTTPVSGVDRTWLLTYPEVDTLKVRFRTVSRLLGVSASELWRRARKEVGFKDYSIPAGLANQVLSWAERQAVSTTPVLQPSTSVTYADPKNFVSAESLFDQADRLLGRNRLIRTRRGDPQAPHRLLTLFKEARVTPVYAITPRGRKAVPDHLLAPGLSEPDTRKFLQWVRDHQVYLQNSHCEFYD